MVLGVVALSAIGGWLTSRDADPSVGRYEPSVGRYEPSPHGCTHGYWVPCDQCSPAIRARYAKNPERFPVYVRDERYNIIGIDRYEP